MNQHDPLGEFISALAEDFSIEELINRSEDLERLLSEVQISPHAWQQIIDTAIQIKIIKKDFPPNWKSLVNVH